MFVCGVELIRGLLRKSMDKREREKEDIRVYEYI